MENLELIVLFQEKAKLADLKLPDDLTQLALCTINGEYFKGISSSKYKSLFLEIENSASLDPHVLVSSISKNITNFLEKHKGDASESIVVLLYGILLLKIFVQQNYTGPPIEDLPEYPIQVAHGFDSFLQRELSLNGEVINVPTHALFYLFLAKLFLERDDVFGLKSYDWWKARCALWHNKSLSYKVEPLLIMSKEGMDKTEKWVNEIDYLNGEIQATFFVEQGIMFNFYYVDPRAVESFARAQKATGLSTNLSASLGVRTIYQQHQIAQLVLIASSKDIEDQKGDVPTEVPLEEDTILLVKPKLELDSESNLRNIDQVVILALCMNIKNNNPKHGLTTEEMMPYVRRVGANPNNWMIHTHHLLLKSRLEVESNKTIERSCLQLEVLTEQFRDKAPDVSDRMKYIFALSFPSVYELHKELGSRFLSLGALNSAIQVFERLNMYEEIIQCLLVTDKNHKAEEMAKQRLEKRPDDFVMIFLLGMVKNDPELYEKAWQVSGCRHSRSKRALGNYYMQKRMWKECIPHYEQALAINYLYPNTWFTLGSSYMHIKDFDKAINAFQKVIQQNPDDGDTWSNLGSCYIQTGRPNLAFKTLQEAAKHKFESWVAWDQLLVVSFQTEQFGEAFHCLRRMLDINKSKFTAKYLFMMNKVLKFHIQDEKNPFGTRFRSNLLDLYTSVTNAIPGDAQIWQSFVQFYEESKLIDSIPKSLECLWRQMRCLKREGWESNKDIFPTLIEAITKIVKYQSLLCEKMTKEEKEKIFAPILLEINAILKRTEEHSKNTKEYKELDGLWDALNK